MKTMSSSINNETSTCDNNQFQQSPTNNGSIYYDSNELPSSGFRSAHNTVGPSYRKLNVSSSPLYSIPLKSEESDEIFQLQNNLQQTSETNNNNKKNNNNNNINNNNNNTNNNKEYDYQSKNGEKMPSPPCYYSSSNDSSPSNTILITQKSSSSITIVTHNKHNEKLESSSRGGTVKSEHQPVVNICINNHYNNGSKVDETTEIKTKFMTQQSNSDKEHTQILTTIRHPEPLNENSTVAIKKEKLPISSESDAAIHFYSSNYNSPLSVKKSLFHKGQDVLVQKHDQKFYLGTIITIDKEQCLVKFDDNSEYWSDFDYITKLSDSINELNGTPMCVYCKKLNDKDIVELCERCGRGFHRTCVKWNNGIWICKRCDSENGPPDKINAKSKLDIYEFDEFREHEISTEFNITSIKHKIRNKLPYDLNALHWDARHHVNEEQIYCYCGKNGAWERKMLQCFKCQQWFHDRCMNCLKFPLYIGDRFYVFICSMCNDGNELIRRLEMNWCDIAHLILFNLTINKNQKYHHIIKDIIPYSIVHWKKLQLPKKVEDLSEIEIRKKLQETLAKNQLRFKNGQEIHKSKLFWGLRKRIPPTQSLKFSIIPMNIAVTDQYLKTQLKLKIIPEKLQNPTQSNSTNDLHLKLENEIIARKDVVRMDIHQLLTTPLLQKINNNLIDSKERSNSSNIIFKSNGERIKHNRKRPTLFSTTLPIDQCDSDDTTSSSLGTLDLIIPPPKNFQGNNNPFCLTPKKKSQNDINSNYFSTPINNLNLFTNNNNYNKTIFNNINNDQMQQQSKQKTFDLNSKLVAIKKTGNQLFGNVNANSAGQFRIVRTFKRRLSAKDIVIGPNNNIKKRKIRRSSGSNVEVISTTIESLPAISNKYKIRQDLFPIMKTNQIASTYNSQFSTSSSSSTSSTSMATTPTKLDINPTKLFSDAKSMKASRRNLRKRDSSLNYFDNPRRNSNSSTGSTSCSNQSTTNGHLSQNISNVNNNSTNNSASIPNSPNENNNCSEPSGIISDLQNSVNMYFGAMERIRNGENFSVHAKRKLPNNKTQYLIEWDCGGMSTFSQ